MQPLDLNLASRPFKNDTLPWVGLVAAVVGLTVMTVWNIRTYRSNAHLAGDLRQQYADNRAEMDQFDGRERKAQRDIEVYDLEALTVRANKANEVIRWKAFSWTQLFNKLQEVLPNDVQMVSIRPVFRPQAGTRRERRTADRGLVPVSVEGISKSLDAFFMFERALLKHPNFDRVDPGGYNIDRNRSVTFQLKFMYEPNPVLEQEEDEAEPEDAIVEVAESDAPPGPGEAQAAGSTGDTAEAVGQPDAVEPADPNAALPSGDAARAAPTQPEATTPEETGAAAIPPVALEGTEEPQTDPAPKKTGRRKSGKRRGDAGRGTEGDR